MVFSFNELFPFHYRAPLLNGEHGYWGPVTSTIDWCEENYALSPFFAEFINSTTNLSFYFLSMYNLYSSIQNKHGLLFVFISIGMCFVGIGSWLFHMTLKYEFQLMDELPMIYVTAIPFAYVFGEIFPNNNFLKYTVYMLTFVFTASLTFIYLSVYKNPELHQASYAVLNFAIIFRTVFLVNKHVKYKNTRKLLYKMVSFSLFEFLFGFFIWNLDTQFCHSLIFLRREIFGLPLGVVLELHGWWHILTSLGIYHFLIYNEILNAAYRGRLEEYVLIWRFGFLAEVVLKSRLERYNTKGLRITQFGETKKD